MQVSRKHHYLPVFYTKRWSGPDCRICEFSKPYGNEVKARKTHPDGTGYVRDLYDMKGLPDGMRDQFERLFLKEVDTKAADALAILEKDDDSHAWTSDQRTAWSRFLLALMFRMPEDVALMKEYGKVFMTRTEPEFDARYAAAKREQDPDTWAEWVAKEDPHLPENVAFRLSQHVMNHEKIGEDINNFRWFTVRTPKAEFELLTSDRPLVISGMGEKNSIIYMPIGPRRIFAAIRHGNFKELNSKDQNRIARRVNKAVVEGAFKYVYGTDEKQLQFIQNRMGKDQTERWASRLLKKERQRAQI